MKTEVQTITATLRLNIKALYRKFFEDSHRFSLLGLTESDKARVSEAIEGLSASNSVVDMEDQSKEHHALAHVFDCCVEPVIAEMERELFPRFVRSDAYVEMMVDRLDRRFDKQGTLMPDNDSDDEDVKTADASDHSEILSPTSSPLVAPMSPESQENLEAGDRSRRESTGWVNEQMYESIRLDILCAKNLRDGAFGKPPNPYCVVSVGSTAFKNKSLPSTSNPDWSHDPSLSHFEFPLRSTMTAIEINIFDQQLMWSHKHLGVCLIPIAPLIRAQQEQDAAHSASPQTYPIRKPGDEKATNPKQRGEMTVVVSFSKDKAKNPSSHKPVTTETSSSLADIVRSKVSKKKKRFVKDGFDLDLSYITDRVIAMGFPSERVEGVYRNNLNTVKLFFDKRHPNHYMVYNLCSERVYDPAKFDGRVARFGFDDHNPCPFELIQEFCQHVHNWLSAHPQHIAAIHCKAGKGRTGLLIACYMLYTGLFPTATQALKYYAIRRTQNRKGVTIPSQIRYVHYYERCLRFEKLLARALANAQGAPSTSDPKAQALTYANSSLSKDQAIAARILGLRDRKMSVTDRAELSDYLGMRNHRYGNGAVPDSKSPTFGVTDGRFRGSYFLPDDDKHHVFLTEVTLHGMPHAVKGSNGESVFFKIVDPSLNAEYNSKDLLPMSTPTASVCESTSPLLDAAHPSAASKDRFGAVHPVYNADTGNLTFTLPPKAVHLFGDVQFTFFYSSLFSGKTKLFQLWLNTRFVVADNCQGIFSKPEIDKINKDTKHKHYPEDFRVEMRFEVLDEYKNNLYSKLDALEAKFVELAQQSSNADDVAAPSAAKSAVPPLQTQMGSLDEAEDLIPVPDSP